MESFNIIYFGSKPKFKNHYKSRYLYNTKTQTINVKNCFNNHYNSACSANKKYGKFTYK